MAKFRMKEIEKLIEQVSAHPENADDELLAHNLLKQFHRGAPLEYLRAMLLSPDERLASLGAWIASELGEQGRPLLGIVGGLLSHASKKVRFWVFDCVLLWAGSSEPSEIAQAIRLIDDPEESVRWKAMDFLSRASRDQLQAALAFLDTEEIVCPQAFGLRWLLSAGGRSAEIILRELKSPDPRIRKYAAVAAARISTENRNPLSIAALSEDIEVAEFARDWS